MKKFILPLILISPLLLYLLWSYVMPSIMVIYMFGGWQALGIFAGGGAVIISALIGIVLFIRRVGR